MGDCRGEASHSSGGRGRGRCCLSDLVLLSCLPCVCPSGSTSLGRSATHHPGPVGLGSLVLGQARTVWLGWPTRRCERTWPRPMTGFLGHSSVLCTCCTTLWEFGSTAALLPFPRAVVGLMHLTSRYTRRKQISVLAVLKPLEHACVAYMHTHARLVQAHVLCGYVHVR